MAGAQLRRTYARHWQVLHYAKPCWITMAHSHLNQSDLLMYLMMQWCSGPRLGAVSKDA